MYYLKGQKDFNDCGKACVATILGLYDISYDYKKLGKIKSFLDILVTLKAYKINCIPLNKEKIDHYPCIIQVKKLRHYHFIVIYEKLNDKYLYYSPNKLMIHKISEKKLNKIYTKKCIDIITIKPYSNYKINLLSLPYSIKIIIIDIFLINLILIILKNMI